MRRFRWVAPALAVVLVAAACSRSDSKTSAPKESNSSSSTTSRGNAATGDFGDLKSLCGPGTPTPSTAQGVTNDAIRIATFSDPGTTARPGLNQELFDVAGVFAKWCNDAGGINGRKIVVDEEDAALTNYKPKIIDACSKAFFMVGGGAVFDNTGVEDRLKCLLPDIAGYVVSPGAREADLLVQPVPNPAQTLPVGDYRWLGKKYPDSKAHVGVLTGSLPATITTAKQAKEAVEKLGWTVVYDDQYPVTGATDWSPYVQAMKNKGVKGLIWVGEPENLAKLEQAMANANYQLDWIRTDANHYDEKLIELGGPALHNTYIRSIFSPFETAAKNSATQQYLDAFARYNPSGKAKAYLGLQAWSAWLLFAQAAKECSANLTRKCVYENAKKVSGWTGGGLHAPTDPAANSGGTCFLIEQATPGGFKTPDINANNGIYSCNKANVQKLTGDYGKGVTLADVGLSESDLK